MKVDEIPSKNVREVRPCFVPGPNHKRTCIFYLPSYKGGECKLYMYTRKAKYSDELDRPEKCPDHFYQEEMQALLDDRNMKDFLCYL